MEADQARLKAYDDNEKVALAQVRARSENEAALRAAVRSVQTTEGYLKIVAPFDGVVTDRFGHKGSLAGPALQLRNQCSVFNKSRACACSFRFPKRSLLRSRWKQGQFHSPRLSW